MIGKVMETAKGLPYPLAQQELLSCEYSQLYKGYIFVINHIIAQITTTKPEQSSSQQLPSLQFEFRTVELGLLARKHSIELIQRSNCRNESKKNLHFLPLEPSYLLVFH